MFISCAREQPSPTVIDIGRSAEPPVVAVAPSASAGAVGRGAIAWHADGEDARARASRSGRRLLVFVTAAWDMASKRMEEQELADPRVVGAARGAVALRIDVTDIDGPHDALFDKLAVKSVPTVVVLAATGRELFRCEKGPLDVDALLDALGAP